MTENVDLLLERGEKIDLLVDKSDVLQGQSITFQKSSKKLKDEMWSGERGRETEARKGQGLLARGTHSFGCPCLCLVCFFRSRRWKNTKLLLIIAGVTMVSVRRESVSRLMRLARLLLRCACRAESLSLSRVCLRVFSSFCI